MSSLITIWVRVNLYWSRFLDLESWWLSSQICLAELRHLSLDWNSQNVITHMNTSGCFKYAVNRKKPWQIFIDLLHVTWVFFSGAVRKIKLRWYSSLFNFKSSRTVLPQLIVLPNNSLDKMLFCTCDTGYSQFRIHFLKGNQ